MRLLPKSAKLEASRGLLAPVMSETRLADAHYAWRDDISRLEGRERHLVDGADHFKQCANLAYWLRRMSPVIEYKDLSVLVEGGEDMFPDERDRRDIFSKYGMEFLAFDFGFKICQYYELEKLDSPRPYSPALSGEYLVDVCHMMKFKHVSPHAMFLVYKSISCLSP